MRCDRNRMALLGTASVIALVSTAAFAQGEAPAAAADAAAAPAADAAVVEEVLVTGSLIRGAPAVGVPVTALSEEAFQETGAMTVTEMLRTVPALEVQETTSLARGGGTIGYGQSISIHGFQPGSGVETLMLVNGKRFPVQGHGGDTVDPSIIPQLAVERIDVLAAGASAVYGSDATSGVVNVILKRGFEGAITQAQISASTDIGGFRAMFGQLYGTNWDSGGITLSYEWYNQRHIDAAARDYFTTNFEPWGLSDHTPLANNVPGVITTGNPALTPGAPSGFRATVGTRFCDNCYSIPSGSGWNFGDQAPGATVSWQELLQNKGVRNQRIPYADSWLLPAQRRNAATLAFDQMLTEDLFGIGPVSLFVDAFYSNRRAIQHYHATGSGNAQQFLSPANGWVVPTNNPYRPTGVPAGQQVRVHYTFAAEMPNTIAGGEIATRWSTGFNFDALPFDWKGNVFYSMTDDHNFAYGRNMINANMLNAALGNTVASQAAQGTIPGQAAFTKPANIPYLNILCDSSMYQCNSEQTLRYISAFRDQDERWKITEWGANFDGPLFELPGGTLRAAIGLQKVSHNFHFFDIENRNPHNTAIISNNREYAEQRSEAIMGELNIPVFGNDFTVPLIEQFVISAGYRYDQYNIIGPVYTPKVAANWTVGYGLTLRGAWGKSFRAPSFQEFSSLSGTRILGVNLAGGGQANTAYELNCRNPAGAPQGVALPGSLTAYLNPTCIGAGAGFPADTTPNQSILAPAGIQVTGGSGAAVALRGGNTLGPQTVKQWSVGFNYAPAEGFLAGLNVDVSLFHIRGENIIGPNTSGEGVNDPNSFSRYIVIPDPNQPITAPVNAPFLAIVNELATNGSAIFEPSIIPNVKFIEDNANTNIGWAELSGIDFDARYDWDMGNWGAWHVGVNGYYELKERQRANDFAEIEDSYEGQNSGARLQRVRYRLGWTDGTWSVTNFVRYYGHSAPNLETVPPDCYWNPNWTGGACYPGAPYNPSPTDIFSNRSPAMYFWDLSIGYNTGDTPANAYLQNLNFQLAINNVLNKRPPFMLRDRGRGRDFVAFDVNYGELQRVVSFTVTKTW